jgi:hypothetical protein
MPLRSHGEPARAPEARRRGRWQALLRRAGSSWWLGAILVILFAASFLRFSRVAAYAIPTEKRVNNGAEPTFFAVHLNPYYLFSEDFHLYYVRARRIASRGWSDSLLYAPEEQGKNYAAPLQAAIGLMAVQTEGNPLRYAVLLSSVLAVAWLTLYGVARRALPRTISPLNVLLAVLLTVLIESLEFALSPHTEFYQWPVCRGLRLSTLAWSNPLLVTVLLAGGSLAIRRRTPGWFLAVVGAGLAVLALSDNWAFMLGWAASGLAFGVWSLGLMRRMGHVARRRLLVRTLAMAGVLLATVALFAAQTGGIRGDALARAGMGPQWHTPGIWIHPMNRDMFRDYALAIGIVLLLGATTWRCGWFTGALRLSASLGRGGLARRQMQIAALAWMPMVALLCIVGAFSWIGTDPYHARQFQWRADYCILFAFCLAVSETIRRWLVRGLLAVRWSRPIELVVGLACVLLLLGYHQYRIHRFLKNTAGREYFLTRDEEQFGQWLADYSRDERGERRYLLATASPELNLLCAYWTDADLWLPSGFPYHSAASRERLETRTADLMRLYNVSSQEWLDFNLHMHADDQWGWARSRLLSARQGYMYYLLHREVWLGGYPGGPNLGGSRYSGPKGSTERVAQIRFLTRAAYVSAAMKSIEIEEGKQVAQKLLHERRERSPFYDWLDRIGGYASWSPQASVAAAERIAQHIDGPSRPLPTPDVIIIDEVSRALGTPTLANYERAFSSPTIEAWVRRLPQEPFAEGPANQHR